MELLGKLAAEVQLALYSVPDVGSLAYPANHLWRSHCK